MQCRRAGRSALPGPLRRGLGEVVSSSHEAREPPSGCPSVRYTLPLRANLPQKPQVIIYDNLSDKEIDTPVLKQRTALYGAGPQEDGPRDRSTVSRLYLHVVAGVIPLVMGPLLRKG